MVNTPLLFRLSPKLSFSPQMGRKPRFRVEGKRSKLKEKGDYPLFFAFWTSNSFSVMVVLYDPQLVGFVSLHLSNGLIPVLEVWLYILVLQWNFHSYIIFFLLLMVFNENCGLYWKKKWWHCKWNMVWLYLMLKMKKRRGKRDLKSSSRG